MSGCALWLSWSFLYLEAYSSTSYTQQKNSDQSSRNMNGYATSTSNCQLSTQHFEPDVEKTAKHIQSIWATCKLLRYLI